MENTPNATNEAAVVEMSKGNDVPTQPVIHNQETFLAFEDVSAISIVDVEFPDQNQRQCIMEMSLGGRLYRKDFESYEAALEFYNANLSARLSKM